MYYHITMDSFGSDLPENWEDIADFLNPILDEKVEKLGSFPERGQVIELCNMIWEQYCNGEIDGAPVMQ